MIEGFVLPKGTGSTQQLIAPAGRSPLQPAHDLGKWSFRSHDYMNVSWHHDPRMQIVPMTRSIKQRVDNYLCEAGVTEPRIIALQAPSHEDYRAIGNPMRQTPFPVHQRYVPDRKSFSQ
jgi:hypothetical protein